MNTKLVSSIDAATRSRLTVVGDGTLLLEVARPLSDTQISLVVVCDAVGAMESGQFRGPVQAAQE